MAIRVALLVAAGALAFADCRTRSSAPLRIDGAPFWARRKGDAAFSISGGGLDGRIRIPLWIELDHGRSDKCPLFNEAFAFGLGDGRIYVEQYNSWCGAGRACRVLDPVSRRWRVPAGGCVVPPGLGIHYRAEPIGDGWIAVIGDAEGVGEMSLGPYSTTGGHLPKVTIGLGHAGIVKARRHHGVLLVESSCDLAGRGCGLGGDPAAPVRTFRWTPRGFRAGAGRKGSPLPPRPRSSVPRRGERR